MAWFRNNEEDEAPRGVTFETRPRKTTPGEELARALERTRVAEAEAEEPLAEDPFEQPLEALPKPVMAAAPVPVPMPSPAPAPVHAPAASASPGSVLGATFRFKGELRADEDLIVQGHIDGSVHHTKTLTIGTEGVLKGDTRARMIIIDGTVDGDLYALESIVVRPTARVHGNLFAPRVSIADGASFNGRIDMSSAARAAKAIVERQSAPLTDVAVASLLDAS